MRDSESQQSGVASGEASGGASEAAGHFLEDVLVGLGVPAGVQKTLPCQYLYDDLGSALFEAITELPEYGLTRADQRLIQQMAPLLPTLFRDGDGRPRTPLVVELGSGSGRKTRHILDAFRSVRGPGAVAGSDEETLPRYVPIDVSKGALAQCARELGSFASVRPIAGTYLDGLSIVNRRRNESAPADAYGQPILLLFLGSSIGNFEPEAAREFLRRLRAELHPGDVLLLGADLRKPVAQMLAAYDDPTGVTAAFNKNLLGRMNRTLGADFDLRSFRHEARWNDEAGRIEMHLVAERALEVTIPRPAPPGIAAGASEVRIRFERGESIWTESSYKYRPEEIRTLVTRAGFRLEIPAARGLPGSPNQNENSAAPPSAGLVAQLIDAVWPFSENVCVAA